MNKYKHLFFDLDNTIWDFNRNSINALRKALNTIHLNEMPFKFDDFLRHYLKINEYYWQQYRERKITKKELINKRFSQTFEELKLTMPVTAEDLNDIYLQEMALQVQLFSNAIEVLEYLTPKYTLHIITNGFREVQLNKMKNSNLEKYFKNVFISEVIQAPKPSKKIFEHAVKSCNARKRESLMIGDSWEADILGAYRFGIDQVYFSPMEKLDSHKEVKNPNKTSTYKISNLIQLTDFI
ncbi:noncanonical pyrimidine nucleotidase, YjjG family [Puteibacter caeruleilacunae]|nr:noncanonical pyrimidine nucleotidase, YjjG family [Puteibacter caeruleilacunae]